MTGEAADQLLGFLAELTDEEGDEGAATAESAPEA
jgi:hypothetical protein